MKISPALIPNTFTSLNLVFGLLSIVQTIQNNYCLAGLFIIFAMAADAMDGRAARFLGVSSDFGKELDSLCDVVSFGAAPAILIYRMYLTPNLVYLLFSLIYAICAAFRLARFNLNTSSTKGFFLGLPSPAAGCFLATFAIAGLDAPPFLVALGVLITGLLMYSQVRYPDFKGKGNPIKPLPAAVGAIVAAWLLYALPAAAIPFSLFFAYLIAGIINFLYVKQLFGGYV